MMEMMKRYRKLFGLLVMVACLMTAGICTQAANIKVPSGSEVLSGGKWKGKRVNGKKKFRYKKENGKFAKNGWKKIEGAWYCVDKSGYVYTGLKKINGNYFYFKRSTTAGTAGKMQTGLVTISGKKYGFKTSGSAGTRGVRFESEWATVKGTEYYFRKDGSVHPQSRLSEEEFIEKIGPLAKADMKNTGILASVTIAQAILESGYGSTSLAMEANNFFGMKAELSGNTWNSDWAGATFSKKTQEWYGNGFVTITAEFRAYPDMSDSIRDHSNYLRYAKNGSRLRYAGVSGNKDYKKTIQLIKNGGYATDPNYVTKICSIIQRFNLTKYDK